MSIVINNLSFGSFPLIEVRCSWQAGRVPFFPNSSLFWKNNARNINYMPVLIFSKCLDLRRNAYSRTSFYSRLTPPMKSNSGTFPVAIETGQSFVPVVRSLADLPAILQLQLFSGQPVLSCLYLSWLCIPLLLMYHLVWQVVSPKVVVDANGSCSGSLGRLWLFGEVFFVDTICRILHLSLLFQAKQYAI